MPIKDELSIEHSKVNTVRVARLVGSNEQLFAELMHVYLDIRHVEMARRAAWVLRDCVHDHPDLIIPYIDQLMDHLSNKNLHDAVLRNGLGLFLEISLPRRIFGKLTDLCFDLLTDPHQAIAVRAFSMKLLARIGDQIPEIRRELKLILEDHYDYGSSGFRSTARKILRNEPV